MKKLAATVLVLALACSAETFKDVRFLHKAEGKEKADLVEGLLDVGAKELQFRSAATSVNIAYDNVTKMVYEKAAKPRYAAGLLLAWPLLFTKSKQHYLTVQYKDAAGGKYGVFRLDKDNFREILAAVESASGGKVERSEER
jgi:hypothetical protein